MDIAFFGQQNWDVCWTAKQQLTTRLARRGHRVLYIDPLPVRSAVTGRETVEAMYPPWSGAGLREREPGLWTFTFPPVPTLLRGNAAARWRFHVLQGMAKRLHMTAPVAIASVPRQRWLQEAVRPAARIYYAVDEWTGFGGLSEEEKRRLREDEERLLAACDVSLGVSPRLVERFKQIQPRSYLQENGADAEHFAPSRLAAATPHPAVANLPKPRLGFVGQVDERLDPELLLYLARRHPDWQIVLAGRVKDGVDVSPLAGQDNIHLLGYVPYAELPGVLREYDVCLVPYRASELTQACNPLKVYEYLATGLPVVSAPLEGLNSCRGVVALAAGPEKFEAAAERALERPAEGREERLALAAEQTWDRRVDLLEERLDEAWRVAQGRRSGPARVSLPVRRARRGGFPLDAKDDSERQLKEGFRDARLSVPQRAFHRLTRIAGWAYYGLRVAGRLVRMQREPLVRRILVVRKSFLGDFITFLPALAALRKRYPAARVVLAVQPNMAATALLEGSDLVDEILPLDFWAKSSRWARLAGAAQLFARGFDLVITGASYYLLREPYFCGAPWRMGLHDGHPWQELGGRVVPLDPNRHETDNNLLLTAAQGAPDLNGLAAPALSLPADATEEAFARLSEQLSLPDGAELMTVHPGGSRPSRRWPPERFAEVIATLLRERHNLRAVITGVPSEEPVARAVIEAVPETLRDRVHGAVGLTKLRGLVGLLDRSVLVLSNDTGVMHLARARNRPLVALLGPENDRRWGPYPLGAGPAIALRHVVPCAPCVRETCDGHYCLELLGVDEALSAARRLLAGEAADGSARLETRRRHHSWRTLQEAGFEVPRVTVVISARGEARVRAIEALARQQYPNVEIVAPGSKDEAVATSSISEQRVRVVEDDGRSPLRTWRRLLAETNSPLLVAWSGERPWPESKLAGDVAALQRSPHAAAAAAPRVYGFAALEDLTDPWLDSILIRREALAARLDAVEELAAVPARATEPSPISAKEK